jgi:hypothetical protein
VPSKQGNDFPGQKTYSLSLQMTHLIHDMDVFFLLRPEDADFAAFIEATSLISSHNAVAEFLASSLWPLG